MASISFEEVFVKVYSIPPTGKTGIIRIGGDKRAPSFDLHINGHVIIREFDFPKRKTSSE